MTQRRQVISLLIVLCLQGNALAQDAEQTEVAIFAGGCFWCVEPVFDKTPGVISAKVGYIGGSRSEATYEQVASGMTQHVEAIKVLFDPARVSYEKLLQLFWYNIDPLDSGGQFCDRGEHYRATIYYQNENQREIAEASKNDIEKRLGRKTVTPIVKAKEFFEAEEYHQAFYRKKPEHYQQYRKGCGRDRRLQDIWGGELGMN